MSESGHAMGALLVSLAIMSILMSMALPVWNQFAQREREAELVFRGEQYVRAVELYERVHAGALAPDVETLVEERFLRRPYSDPMAKNGKFRIVYQGDVNEFAERAETGPLPGQAAGGIGAQSRLGSGQRSNVSEGFQGGVVGVVSESEQLSIRFYKGGTGDNEWLFFKDDSPVGFSQVGSEFGSGVDVITDQKINTGTR